MPTTARSTRRPPKLRPSRPRRMSVVSLIIIGDRLSADIFYLIYRAGGTGGALRFPCLQGLQEAGEFLFRVFLHAGPVLGVARQEVVCERCKLGAAAACAS